MMWIISFVWRRRTPASLNLIVRGQMDLTSQLSQIVVASVYDMGTAYSLAPLLNAELISAEVVAGSQVIGEARRSTSSLGPTSS